jgi:hypothetical protein
VCETKDIFQMEDPLNYLMKLDDSKAYENAQK